MNTINWGYSLLSTTVIMENGIWTYAASLPVKIDFSSAENLGNLVFLFGELIALISSFFFCKENQIKKAKNILYIYANIMLNKTK